VVCSLTDEQAALYQSVVTTCWTGFATGEGIERGAWLLGGDDDQTQTGCNHPAQLLRDR